MNQSLAYEFTQVMPLVAATGVQVSLCNILVRATAASKPVTDSLGQVDLATSDFTILPGHANIPCQLAVNKLRADEGAEIHTPTDYETMSDRTLELNGYYPLILQQHLAQVDGVVYQIMGTDSDSQSQVTRLAVRIYTL